MLQPGTILDNKYEIEAPIGQGGFGYVYRARERLTEETVAIKELVPAFVDSPEMVQRFIQEARATLRLTHPKIVRTHGIFEDQGTYYLAMEYLARGSLADALKRGLPPMEQATRIATELCEALAYAHREGVIHCDIKPANVLFDEKGRARLADFGIAHVSAELMTRQLFTATGTTMGTVQYMAPEQLEGVRDDPRIDVYAVGAVLYEMLAGQPYLDFDTEATPAAQMRNVQRIQSEQPRPLGSINPGVPQWLVDIVRKALRKTPDERFSEAKEMLEALRQLHERAPSKPTQVVRPPELEPASRVAARSSSLQPRPTSDVSRESKRHRFSGVPVWALVGLAAFGCLVLSVLLIGQQFLPTASTPTIVQQAIESRPAFEHGPTDTLAPPTDPTLVVGLNSEAIPTLEQRTPEANAGITIPGTSTSARNDDVAARASSTPEVTRSPTPVPIRRFKPIPLGSVANAAAGFESPLTGEVVLAGVQFQLSESIFKTQASPAPDNTYPTKARLPVAVSGARRLHLLITAGNGFNAFESRVVGQVVATCNGSSISVASLQLGRDVREWHVAQNVVSSASRAQQVWQGAIAAFPGQQGHIDMLSLDLPIICQRGQMTAVEIVDTSVETVQSLDPALNLTGVTVEYFD